jgi:hypothetical protein
VDAFHIRYRKHAREYRHATNKSNYVKHLLDTTEKGPMLNTLEKLYMYHETIDNNQLNDKNAVVPKAIFNAVIRNYGDSTPHLQAII